MNTVELASRILTQLGFYQEPSKELGVDDRRDNIVNLIEEYTHPAELTDEEIEDLADKYLSVNYKYGEDIYVLGEVEFARAILRKAQEK